MRRYRRFVVQVEYDTEHDLEGREYPISAPRFPTFQCERLDPDREITPEEIEGAMDFNWGWFAEVTVEETT